VTTSPQAFDAAGGAPLPAGARYRERLWPSWWLWLTVLGWSAMLAVAVGAAAGATAGWAVAALVAAVCTWALQRLAWRIEVDASGLRVGPVLLPAVNVGSAAPLDAAAARRLRGVGADARAFMVLRGWVATAVRVDLDDEVDPTPYWMVSTRHPEQLARALAGIRRRG